MTGSKIPCGQDMVVPEAASEPLSDSQSSFHSASAADNFHRLSSSAGN